MRAKQQPAAKLVNGSPPARAERIDQAAPTFRKLKTPAATFAKPAHACATHDDVAARIPDKDGPETHEGLLVGPECGPDGCCDSSINEEFEKFCPEATLPDNGPDFKCVSSWQGPVGTFNLGSIDRTRKRAKRPVSPPVDPFTFGQTDGPISDAELDLTPFERSLLQVIRTLSGQIESLEQKVETQGFLINQLSNRAAVPAAEVARSNTRTYSTVAKTPAQKSNVQAPKPKFVSAPAPKVVVQPKPLAKTSANPAWIHVERKRRRKKTEQSVEATFVAEKPLEVIAKALVDGKIPRRILYKSVLITNLGKRVSFRTLRDVFARAGLDREAMLHFAWFSGTSLHMIVPDTAMESLIKVCSDLGFIFTTLAGQGPAGWRDHVEAQEKLARRPSVKGYLLRCLKESSPPTSLVVDQPMLNNE
jgi:hypothetical protein